MLRQRNIVKLLVNLRHVNARSNILTKSPVIRTCSSGSGLAPPRVATNAFPSSPDCTAASVAVSKVSESSLATDVSRYTSFTDRTHACGELSSRDIGRHVMLCGWVDNQRMGGQFVLLRDAVGIVQVVVSSELNNKLDRVPLESVIRVGGLVRQRPEGQSNVKMTTGEVEVVADSVEVLNPCKAALPFQVQDFHLVKESLRLQYRYLDLRNKRLQANIRLRSQVIHRMRRFLCEMHRFVDVETPTLFRRTPGGAREFVVPTHATPGTFYSLPQSPQQFKQLLMVGAIDRYMQIARCYRDESSKPDRQPEFTQLDLEMSFITQSGITSLIEELLAYCWPSGANREILDHSSEYGDGKHGQSSTGSLSRRGLDYEHDDDHSDHVLSADVRNHVKRLQLPPITLPFQRISYSDAMRLYGSDKPDTRFESLLNDVTQIFSGCKFEPLTSAHSVQAVVFHSCSLSRAELDEVLKTLREGKVLTFSAVTRVKADGSWSGGLNKRFDSSTVDSLTRQLQLSPGDVFALTAGEYEDACLVAGKFRTEVWVRMNDTTSPIDRQMKFLWVEEFPLFRPHTDGTAGWESAHHPFTAPHPDDVDLVRPDPGRVRSQHYDLVLNGTEVGGGSIRIHDSQLQRYVLKDVLGEDPRTLEHLLEALDFGCPPHGGIALGLDRLLAIICGEKSVRDVIAFPKSTDGRCLMSRAPATISDADLDYYHVTVKKET